MNKIDQLMKAKEEAAEHAAQTKAAAESAAADAADSEASIRQLDGQIAALTVAYEDSPEPSEWEALVAARTARDQHAARLDVRKKRATQASASAAAAAAELAKADREVAYEHAREAVNYAARHPELVERAERVLLQLADLGREFERLDLAARPHWGAYCESTGIGPSNGYLGHATREARIAAQAAVDANLMAIAYALGGAIGHRARTILENTTPVGRW
jgi:hypothetical protein